MKALVVKRFGNPLEMIIEERPKPSAQEGFTLIRMHSATINQLSNTIRKGGSQSRARIRLDLPRSSRADSESG
jgi:NADPH:quinone reductase-like Zn-dependent oxidoreductase